MNKFEQAIFDGLKQTIKDYVLLKGIDFENEWSKPEYLATVNIAKSLTQFNGYPAEKIIIAIEENTKPFSTSCVKEEFEDIFSEPVFQLFNTSRNGKIDIAVYETHEKRPLCTIEVKNFNPIKIAKAPLISDLKRNAQYFKFRSKSNKTLLKKTYVCYFRHFEETKSREQIAEDLKNAKDELIAIIDENNLCSSDLNIRVETQTVHENLLYDDKYPMEMILEDTGEMLENAVHFVGVLAVFELNRI